MQWGKIVVSNAIAWNIRRNKSVSAINSFVSSITDDVQTKKVLLPKRRSNYTKMYKEIAKEFATIGCEEIVFPTDIDIREIASAILQTSVVSKNKTSTIFLQKCRLIETVLWVALILGIVSSIFFVVIRNVIDPYFVCFLVWILSCISLLVTLRLIIKDWKDI